MDAAEVAALGSPIGRAALAAVGRYDPATALATASRLRASGYPADLVAAALTQARLRLRAQEKFGAAADRMLFTPDGLEQATRARVAVLRATRIARFVGAGRVVDLCCGIGGDLLALAGAGVAVEGVDIEPATAAVAASNVASLGLAAPVTCGDATAVDLAPFDAVVLDPSRRAGGRRVFDPDAYRPPWPFVEAVLRRDSCVKVAPGIPHARIPAGVEAEWVSDAGAVKEAALWSGALTTVPRRATLLPAGATLVGSDAGAPPVRAPQRWLYEPDGAVIRAHLVAEVAALIDGALLDRRIAYLTSPARFDTPFARAYEVTDVLPFSLRRLRTLLRSRDVGVVTIKKRGSAVEPETLRRQLRLSGSEHAVVVVTRIGDAPTVLLCRPPAQRSV